MLLGFECGVLLLFDMFILSNLEANCGLLGFCVIILIVNFEYGYTEITRSLNILTELIVIITAAVVFRWQGKKEPHCMEYSF